jgi:uncharacterized protein (DUF1684 family)
MAGVQALELADWRRRVGGLYATVRATPTAQVAHALWRSGRDELFRAHPQSPLPAEDPLRASGLPYWPYDPAFRFEVPVIATVTPQTLRVDAGEDGLIQLRRLGWVDVPAPVSARLAVWWLDQYAGGIFLPVRDGTAGNGSYGGGRYLLDTAKGADLGGALLLDFNFLYHPSCRYSPAWMCPLAPADNTIAAPITAGEML